MRRAIVIAGLLLAAAGARGAVMERVWMLFGPADLGPVTFETLERRATPNDALACPPGLCRARADMAPPVFAVRPEALKAAMARVLAAEADVTRVADAPLEERLIQRTRWLRFPDTIVVRYLAVDEGRSTLALYSRSRLGRGDFGVNRARLARWLGGLSAQAPIAP